MSKIDMEIAENFEAGSKILGCIQVVLIQVFAIVNQVYRASEKCARYVVPKKYVALDQSVAHQMQFTRPLDQR